MNLSQRLTSVFVAVALSFSLFVIPASAVDEDSNKHYSLPSVASSPVALADYPISLADFSSSDSTTLTNIYKFIQYLTTTPSSYQQGSIIGLLHRILSAQIPNASTNFQLIGGYGTNGFLNLINSAIQDVEKSNNSILNKIADIETEVAAVNTNAGNLDVKLSTRASETTLSAINTLMNTGFLAPFTDTSPTYNTSIGKFLGSAFATTRNNALAKYNTSFPYRVALDDGTGSLTDIKWYSFSGIMGTLLTEFAKDGRVPGTYDYSMFHYVKQLSQVLASDDDKALAESQKENREQIEKDFVSGSSGSTSLGKGDFSSASDVSGLLSDSFKMDGASNASDFVSGFGTASNESLAWFSQTTADNLDEVDNKFPEKTTGVSTFSARSQYMEDADSDPYNMAGFADRYSWLPDGGVLNG